MEYYIRSLKDDLIDRFGMNNTEIGIFNMLIDHYMMYEKPIPLNINEAVKITNSRSYAKVGKILENHFKKTDQGFIHERHEKILNRVKKARDKKRNLEESEANVEELPVDNLWITSGENKEFTNPTQIQHKSNTNPTQIEHKSDTFFEKKTEDINNLQKKEAFPFKLKALNFKHKEKNIIKEKGESETIGFNFQKFIAAYPKKVDRIKNDKAANIWRYEKMDMHFSEIMKSIAERSEHSDWAEMIEQNNYQFMNDPATFLKKKLYEQEFTRVQPKISEDERIRLECLKIQEDYENGKL